MSGYFISTGNIDLERLNILNEIYNESTFSFLRSHHKNDHLNVLEVGCGTGDLAIWMAKNFNVEITAVDMSEENILICKDKCDQNNLKNINFISGSIEDVIGGLGKLDFVYGRLVFMFIKNLHNLVGKIYSKLTNKGVFCLEEISLIKSGHFTYPEYPVIDQWHRCGVSNAIASDLDPDLASKIPKILNENGFNDISVKCFQPILKTQREKSVYALGIQSVNQKMNTLSKEELFDMLNLLSKVESDSKALIGFFRNLQISCKKY